MNKAVYSVPKPVLSTCGATSVDLRQTSGTPFTLFVELSKITICTLKYPELGCCTNETRSPLKISPNGRNLKMDRRDPGKAKTFWSGVRTWSGHKRRELISHTNGTDEILSALLFAVYKIYIGRPGLAQDWGLLHCFRLATSTENVQIRAYAAFFDGFVAEYWTQFAWSIFNRCNIMQGSARIQRRVILKTGYKAQKSEESCRTLSELGIWRDTIEILFFFSPARKLRGQGISVSEDLLLDCCLIELN